MAAPLVSLWAAAVLLIEATKLSGWCRGDGRGGRQVWTGVNCCENQCAEGAGGASLVRRGVKFMRRQHCWEAGAAAGPEGEARCCWVQGLRGVIDLPASATAGLGCWGCTWAAVLAVPQRHAALELQLNEELRDEAAQKARLAAWCSVAAAASTQQPCCGSGSGIDVTYCSMCVTAAGSVAPPAAPRWVEAWDPLAGTLS